MLASSDLVAFVPSSDPQASRQFYEGVLGLRFIGDDRAALLFDANGTVVRIVGVDEVAPQPYTILGWEVEDIGAVVGDLANRGVEFQDFDFLDDDNPSVWSSPDGSQVAWFRDPDGNMLSVFQTG
jgi:catechol 2,3-dioxygenase-like lactoylglutathione lyase family enzyme